MYNALWQIWQFTGFTVSAKAKIPRVIRLRRLDSAHVDPEVEVLFKSLIRLLCLDPLRA
jgi:hypothetical protein